MASINFKTKLFKIGDWTILQLPKESSAKLPSRGMVMGEGTINGVHFQSLLEPDGKGSHWFKINSVLAKSIGAKAGDSVVLEIEPNKNWPEPEVPVDIQKALDSHKQAGSLWHEITPMARWEWIRWIRSTGKQETRQKRIEVACDKLKKGERRPCCWNRNLSTEPQVSKNGVLLDPRELKNGQ
jgi:hypothetical protein